MITHSESVAKIAAALVKVSAEIENPHRNARNPHFKNDYADLSEIVNVSRPILAKHGLTVMQCPGMEDGRLTLDSLVLHESGEWIRGVASSPLPKNDPQGVGSATTYLRRYSLAALLGLAQEDDDGEGARPDVRDRVTGEKYAVPPIREPHGLRPMRELAGEEPQGHVPTPQRVANGAGPSCPQCGGDVWDNRTNKKNPKSPDWSCKDKTGCKWAIWLDAEQRKLRESLDNLVGAGVIKPASADHLMEGVKEGDLDALRMATDWVATKARETVPA